MNQPDPTQLRAAIAAEFQRLDAHEWGYDHGFSADPDADPETSSFVDAVLAVVQPLLDTKDTEREQQVDAVASRATAAITGMGADVRQARAERDRYRLAWLSARQRADCRTTTADLAAQLHTTQRVWDEYHLMKARAEAAELTARSAAVLLRVTADKAHIGSPINPGPLRAAARDIDEITKETST